MSIPGAISSAGYMAVAATWSFGSIAALPAVHLLQQHRSSLDAIEQGIRTLELDVRDQYYVGVGGLPNANGQMELDAALMDHQQRYGAVMAIPRIKNPISVARSVLELCVHNVLVGEGALQWAVDHGFEASDEVLTAAAKEEWIQWKESQHLHAYEPLNEDSDQKSHDTIGLICLDSAGCLAAGTSTSGWKFKHPGRVGDAPMVGSGIYCDSEAAAVATGDGEEIMRTCLSFLVVEFIKQGFTPQQACSKAIHRLKQLPPASNINMHAKLTVGLVAMDKFGNIGAASTLDQDNLHRGNPYFPVVCWRGTSDSNDHPVQENELITLQASWNGAAF